jgi:hypothetical protein
MVRWIAFDDETAEAVIGRFKRGAAEIREGEQPLGAALRYGRPSVLILPAKATGRVLLVSIEPKTNASSTTKAHSTTTSKTHAPAPVRYQATGFLGLTDEPVFEEEEPETPPKKKSWWPRRAA